MFFKKLNGYNRALLTLICILLTAIDVEKGLGQSSLADVSFDEYFVDKALRLELFQCGDARSSVTTVHGLAEEPIWPENPQHRITPFLYGRFLVKVYASDSEQLIFSKGFDTLFAEYATTGPALLGHKRVFETTTRIPMPKRPIKLTIDQRLGDNSLVTVLAETIDPKDVRIRRESVRTSDKTSEIQNTGHAHQRLDLVFLSEGYTAIEESKFLEDVKRMSEHLFSIEPYKSQSGRFNVRGVFRASEESGTDQPRQAVFKNTALNSSFNTLDIDRYLLLEENHRMHQMAAGVPYDTIVVLVNTATYGGGSICLDYCICSTGHPASKSVFVHELGHGMSYLADEYVGNVSYNDMYPAGIEPVEPNITRELDPSKIKWKAFLSKDILMPTSKNRLENGEPVVGAFEGGGYLAKGIYRAEEKCLMGTADPNQKFCAACKRGIEQMIDFYAPLP